MKSLLSCLAAFAVLALEATPVVRFSSDASFNGADTMIRFTTPVTFDVAVDQSEVQAVFDEKNLYLSARGWYDGKTVRLTDELKRKNLFEFFVQADVADPRYVQVRVRENGEFDSYEFDQGVKRKCERETGIRVSVDELPAEKAGPHKGLVSWRANAVIPFKILGSSTPKTDRAARLGVMRHNVSLSGGRTEDSSLTPVVDNYGLSQSWRGVTFTRKAGAAQTVRGDVRNFRVNYFANGEFDIPGRCWQTFPRGGHVEHVETMAMSGEWIYRTTGNTYRFLCGEPDSFEPNTDYTLMVKARRFGDEGTLRILTMKKLPDGRPAEGLYLGGNIALGADFHEYYFPFRTDADQPTMINFYRLGAAGEDKGVEIAAVKLFKGHVSALEFRQISRIGMKTPIKGTELPMRPNPYGRRAEKLNALAFVRTMQDIREVQEVFAGLNVTLDVLRTTAADQDIYETDSDLEAVRRRLDKGAYGLFLVGERAADRIGGEMSKKILAAVRDGAGLLVCPNKKVLHFEKALAAAKLTPLESDHTLRKAFPAGLYRPERRWDKPVSETLKTGVIGKGRVVSYPCYRLRPRMDPRDYGTTDFALSDFLDPWVARVLYWTAGIGSEKSVGKAVPLKTDTNLGKVISSRLIVDGEGRTLDYEADVTDKTGPRVFVSALVDSVKGDSPFVFEIATSNVANQSVQWRLEDCAGRVLETGSGTGRVEVPTRALYTNLGIFRAELMDGQKVVDAVRVNAYARDRDTKRTYDDFTASIWPMGDNVAVDTIRAADKRLVDIGFRASLLPIGSKCALTLSGGLALGGGFLGGGDVFCGHPHKDNVRTTGEINTAKGRRMLAERAQEEARKTAKYGVTQCVVCDEPNLSMRHCEMEPDEQPENIAEYRVRMERKYGTLDVYNRRHGTDYADWSKIGPAHLKDARASGRYAEFLEWRAFNVDRWCEVIRHLADNGKKADPDLKLALYNSFGQTALSGNDYWKLLTAAGLEFSNEYTAMVYFGRNAIYNFDEFYRSFRPDLRVWGFTGYQLSKEQIAFMPWWFAAHRYGGFTWFATWSWLWNVLDIPTCALNGDSVALKASLADSRLLDGLGKLTLDYAWAPRDVALYYSHESLMVSTLLGSETKSFEIAETGPLHEYMYSRQGLQYLVEGLLYQHDFVAPEQIVKGAKDREERAPSRPQRPTRRSALPSSAFLNSYKILFMPRILAMSDAEVAAVKAFVKAGGTVVADVMPGEYDELGMKRMKKPFEPGEIKVWGRSFDDFDRSQHAEMLSVLKAAGARPVLESPGIEDLDGREAMHFTDGVNDLFFVLRMTARSSDAAEQTFVFPKKGHAYDLRRGNYLGEADRVTAKVPLSGASVWAVCAAKTEGIDVTGLPADVTPGRDLDLRLSLRTDGGPAGKRVFNVKLFRPDGTTSFLFARNLSASDGKASFRFRMAHNDPKGIWKLVVTDALTGVSSERKFTVR